MLRSSCKLTRKLLLFLLSRLQRMYSKSALTDHNIRPDGRYLSHDQMPIFLPRVIPRIEDVDPCYFYLEHGRT